MARYFGLSLFAAVVVALLFLHTTLSAPAPEKLQAAASTYGLGGLYYPYSYYGGSLGYPYSYSIRYPSLGYYGYPGYGYGGGLYNSFW